MSKFFFSFLSILLLPTVLFAQYGEGELVYRAKVISVVETYEVSEPSLYGIAQVQKLEAEILQGERKGERVTFENDYIQLKKGTRFFLGVASDTELSDVAPFRVVERDRVPMLGAFVLLFVLVILFFGKKQGLRSIFSLAGSIFIIGFVLIPSLLKGVNPVFISTALASLILFIAIFFTHGFKRESFAAFLGTVIAVAITSGLSVLAVLLLHFAGLGTEEAWYLREVARDIDFGGLLLGGIVIGVLGVLDDIAVTQVSVVRELYGANPSITKPELYTRALRVGQEHVGALVNTLALAYTGAALPLLMLFAASPYPISVLMSQELFSVEIIRTIVGSIGLVCTVPITTALAVYMLERYRGQKAATVHHHGHGHSHSH